MRFTFIFGKIFNMFGQLNDQEIETLFHQQLIGRIGCHADGITYVVPVSYAYDGKHVYVHSYEGMKLEMMRKNPKLCFEVDDTHDLANWQSAIAWGDFEEVKDGESRRYGIAKLYERVLPFISSSRMHMTPQWPFPTQDVENISGIIFRIELKNKTGRFERSDPQEYYAS